jgi:hypothetical protein
MRNILIAGAILGIQLAMTSPSHARCLKWWGGMERFNSTCIET